MLVHVLFANDLVVLVTMANISDWKNYVYEAQGTRTKNTVLAAPNGSDGKATFRTLVETDIPALSKSKVGLNNVDNTADSAKNVLSASKLTTARNINGVAFDGTNNITITATIGFPQWSSCFAKKLLNIGFKLINNTSFYISSATAAILLLYIFLSSISP